MDHDSRLAAIPAEADALVAALRAAAPDGDVPTCEGWAVGDLTSHVGGFATYWLRAAELGGQPDYDGIGAEIETAKAGDDLVGWVEAQVAGLIDQLGGTQAEAPAWTWDPTDQTVRFVTRRVLHELAVHRVDAQSAVGTPEPIPAAVAVDGIDEIFDSLFKIRPAGGGGTGQTMHLHGTDDGVSGEWLVTLASDGVAVRREHAKGDLAIRGSASDLEMVLFGRPPLGDVERFGDESVLDQWRADFTF